MKSRQKRHIRHSALSEAPFRRYFPASWFSSLGSWLLRFLLGWTAWDLTESATWVGVVAALMLAPAFVLSPVFGIVSDRVNPRYGLITSMAVHGLIGAAGTFCLLLDLFDLTALLILAFAMGAVTSGHSPMRLALVPLLVRREALPSAVGLSAITFNVARIIGPALGAWLISRWGVEAAFALSVTMFATSASILLSLHGVGYRTAKPREPFRQQLIAGLVYTRRHPGIRLLFALTLLNGLLGRTVIELLPALSGALLGGGPEALAKLTASAGVGSIVGGLIVSRQRASLEHLLTLVISAILGALLLMLTLYWMQDVTRLAVFVSLLALCATMAGTGSQTMTQLSLPDDFRGRVISLWTLLAMGAPAIGSALLGALSDSIGFVAVLAGVAVGGTVLLGVLFQRRRDLLASNVEPSAM